jgi:hypothetical protein
MENWMMALGCYPKLVECPCVATALFFFISSYKHNTHENMRSLSNSLGGRGSAKIDRAITQVLCTPFLLACTASFAIVI